MERFLILTVAAVFAIAPAQGGTITRPTPRDPLLQDAPGACAAAADQPDYVPGIDAAGNPVPRADLGSEKAPVPNDMAVAVAGGRGYINLDGAKLSPLLNPAPCGH